MSLWSYVCVCSDVSDVCVVLIGFCFGLFVLCSLCCVCVVSVCVMCVCVCMCITGESAETQSLIPATPSEPRCEDYYSRSHYKYCPYCNLPMVCTDVGAHLNNNNNNNNTYNNSNTHSISMLMIRVYILDLFLRTVFDFFCVCCVCAVCVLLAVCCVCVCA